MSQQATLYEALLQSGQLFRTTVAINGNADFSEVNAVLLDWNWPNTLLVDNLAIRYTPWKIAKLSSVATLVPLVFRK